MSTGSSPAGVKLCRCREQGIFPCSCLRCYPDPDAILSVGTVTGVFISNGYTLYELTVADNPYELPLFVTLAHAHRHDSVLGVVALA